MGDLLQGGIASERFWPQGFPRLVPSLCRQVRGGVMDSLLFCGLACLGLTWLLVVIASAYKHGQKMEEHDRQQQSKLVYPMFIAWSRRETFAGCGAWEQLGCGNDPEEVLQETRRSIADMRVREDEYSVLVLPSGDQPMGDKNANQA